MRLKVCLCCFLHSGLKVSPSFVCQSVCMRCLSVGSSDSSFVRVFCLSFSLFVTISAFVLACFIHASVSSKSFNIFQLFDKGTMGAEWAKVRLVKAN